METSNKLRDAIIWFADFEHCRQFMIQLHWPNGVVKCPHCGADKITYLEKQRVWKCYAKHERPTFSLKTGTIFEDSPIPLEKWLTAAWLLISCKNGVSSYEIHRALGVTQKSAWFMLHRIRLAMQNNSILRMGQEGGPVEADETFIGGKRGNKHLKYRAGQWNVEKDNKVAVFGMLDRNTREIRAKVIPDLKRETLQNEILDQVTHGSKIYTDNWTGYRGLKNKFVHETVTHIDEYVGGQVHTQGIENFWSLLKCSLNGTYVAVEPFHLDRYVGEPVFRYNNRLVSDAERFTTVMKQIVGLRLTYDELTGKTERSSESRP